MTSISHVDVSKVRVSIVIIVLCISFSEAQNQDTTKFNPSSVLPNTPNTSGKDIYFSRKNSSDPLNVRIYPGGYGITNSHPYLQTPNYNPFQHYYNNNPFLHGHGQFFPYEHPHQQHHGIQHHNSFIPPKNSFTPSLPFVDPYIQRNPYYPFQTSPWQGKAIGYPGIGGIGSFPGYETGLPRQVRVPGKIQINLIERDAEITCEFPRYLLLVQKVYWHHKFDDPFGSYYDETNGFGPRVRVVSPDQWTSILTIRDFTEDDYGPYRCISAAVLPEDTQQSYSHRRLLASESTTISANAINNGVYSDDRPYEFDSGENNESSKSPLKSGRGQRGKSLKFPSTQRSNKVRFSRSVTNNDLSPVDSIPESSDKSSTMSPHTSSGPKQQQRNSAAESNFIESEQVYDPFTQSRLPSRNYGLVDNYWTALPHHYGHGTNPYAYDFNNRLQNFPYSLEDKNPGTPPGTPGFPGNYGLHAPFYKPNYSVFTVYQEVHFTPREYQRSSTSTPGK